MVLFLSSNPIYCWQNTRSQKGDVVVWGSSPEIYELPESNGVKKDLLEALYERHVPEVAEAWKTFTADLEKADEVFIYWGGSIDHSEFISRLLAAGKRVKVMACHCDDCEHKYRLMSKPGLRWEWIDCGGEMAMADCIQQRM